MGNVGTTSECVTRNYAKLYEPTRANSLTELAPLESMSYVSRCEKRWTEIRRVNDPAAIYIQLMTTGRRSSYRDANAAGVKYSQT